MKITNAAILASVLFVLGATVQANDSTESKVLREEKKDFSVVMDPIAFADAYGSRETGPHGTFGKFPPNFATPEQTHSHGYRAIVLKGEMTNPFDNEANPPVMKPGSYWAVAAGEKHITVCVSDTPCEFFMFSNDGFDFAPTE